jgi:hypothetical protein
MLPEIRTSLSKIEIDKWLTETKVVSVDIETYTEQPDDRPKVGKYGLSYLTDIYSVSMVSPEIDYAATFTTPSKEELEFVKNVLSRDNIIIVAHNAVFDMRLLGGHLGFQVARHSGVWCTQSMSIRLLLGDSRGEKFGLDAIAERLGIVKVGVQADAEILKFLRKMKESRKNLQPLAEKLLKEAEPDSVLWVFAGGYVPPDQDELIAKAVSTMLMNYVTFDAVITLRIYRKQVKMIEVLTSGGSIRVKDQIIPRWPEGLADNVSWELRGMRVQCNQAIVGIKFNHEYADKKLAGYQKEMEDSSKQLLQLTDDTDPFPNFPEFLGMIRFYSMVLDVIRTKDFEKKKKVSFNNPNLWAHWKFIKLAKGVVKSLFSSGVSEKDAELWEDFLLSLTAESRRKDILQNPPKTSFVPKLKIREFIRTSCFPKEEEVIGSYLARLKLEWWDDYNTMRKTMDFTALVNKNKFKPYLLFVLARLPIPTWDTINTFGLVTQKAAKKWSSKEFKSSKEFFAWLLENNGLSLGKDNLKYLLGGIGEDEDEGFKADSNETLNQFRIFLTASARHTRVSEWKKHASRDGRIHSATSPLASTKRDTSSNPNIQNIKMKEFKGLLVGDKNQVLVETDYSNAELNTSAMTGRDNAMAKVLSAGDAHSQFAASYYGELWKVADSDRRQELRDFGKTLTFAGNYAAGVNAIHRKLVAVGMDITVEEVQDMFTSRNKSYPDIERMKQRIADTCRSRVEKQGLVPYITLWDGSRIQIGRRLQEDRRTGQMKLIVPYYTCWNGIQQGSVSVMTHRGMIEAYEFVEDNFPNSRVAINIHDSLITATDPEDADELLPSVCKFMDEQVPDELCRQTNPKIYFRSCVGPENSKKWGYVPGKDYPLSMNHFYNQWGKHEMPEGEEEAPVWRVNQAAGETIESDNVVAEKEDEPAQAVVIPGVNSEWSSLYQQFEPLATALTQVMSDHVLKVDDKEYRFGGEFLGGILEALLHKGHQVGADTLLKEVIELRDGIREMSHTAQRIDWKLTQYIRRVSPSKGKKDGQHVDVTVSGESPGDEEQKITECGEGQADLTA